MEWFVTIKTQFEIYIVIVSDIPLNVQIFWVLTPDLLFKKNFTHTMQLFHQSHFKTAVLYRRSLLGYNW